MPVELPAMLVREAMQVLATTAAPLFLGVLVVGLLVGVMQTATQIQDPAVGALPRLLTAGGIIFALGGWMMQRMADFLASAIQRMAERGF